ncbi:MAG TPA: hypothetical protein VHU80_15715 [Polyangiaceae bacterium]|nr:hypothetical protein [Polyangiaceae bacterium]
MTTLPEDEHGLEQRAKASKTRLLETIDALERRGARLVATAHEMKNLAALVVDGVAIIGALSSLLALVRAATSSRAQHPVESRAASKSRNLIGKLTVFAMFAGVAYVARQKLAARPDKATTVPFPTSSRLRAVP